MRRDLAAQMMTLLRQIETPVNALSALTEQLEGDERTRARRAIGQVIATVGAIQLDIAKQHPDLDADKAS